MAPNPADYPWSSYRHNASGVANPAIQAHICYTRLDACDAQRHAAYREFVHEVCDEDTANFRDHLNRQQPVGNDRFWATIGTQLGRSLTPGKSGRPAKADPARQQRKSTSWLPLISSSSCEYLTLTPILLLVLLVFPLPSVPQSQALCARERANWISLDEAQSASRPHQTCWLEQ